MQGLPITPLVAGLHQRSQRFHAEIARRASMVPHREVKSYFIPNTPFGVPKFRAAPPPRKVQINPMDLWYHTMWFYDLVMAPPVKTNHVISIAQIQRATANHFDISLTELLSDRRQQRIVTPRQTAMYLAKKLTVRSLPEIGRKFGGRDHTTVIHAVRKIEKRIAADQEFAARVAVIAAGLA